MRLLRTSVLCGLAIGLCAIPSLSATINWTNPYGGLWRAPTNWSSYPYLPGSGDDARITITCLDWVNHDAGSYTVRSLYCDEAFLLSGGTLTLQNASEFLAAFSQTNGTLAGNGTISLSGNSQWSGGTISSLGGVTNYGTWDFTGSATRYLSGYITNRGTINQSGPLDINSGGRLYNPSGKVYEIKSDTGITSSAPTGLFDNYGRFRKTTTTGTSTIACAFNNAGSVEAYSGKLQFTGGGTWRSGDITADSYSPGVVFSGGTYTIDGASRWDRYGSVALSGATLSMMQGSLIECWLLRGFKIMSGTISGLGIIRNYDSADWSGGTLSGMGGFENHYTMTLSGTQFKYLQNTPFTNANYITHTGQYGLVFSQSSRFANLVGATYELQGDADFISLDGTGQIDNGGTILKDYSYGTSYVDPYLNSSGTLDVESGTVELWGGGQFVNGGAAVDHLARLALMNGNYTIYGQYMSGYGGIYALSGGTLTFTEGATASFGLEQGLSLEGSTVTGHGNLINTMNMGWSAGTITGTTHFINKDSLTIAGDGSKTLTNAEFYNEATTLQTASVGLNVGAGGLLTNQSTGSFEFRSDAGITGTGTIVNGGVFSKLWDGSTSVIEPTFNNTFGSFDIDQGCIRLTGGGSFQDGGGSLTYPGSLSIYSGTYSVQGQPLFAGTGTAQIQGGTLNLAAPAQMRFSLDQGLDLSGGTINGPGNLINTRIMNWSGGTITGTAHLSNESELTISGSSQKLLSNAQFHNLGSTVQTGAAGLTMASGALLSCPNGSSYEFRTDAGISGTGTINNSGILYKNYGTGTSVIQPALNCIDGGMNITSGSVKLTGGGSFYNGGASISEPCSLIFGSGNFGVTGDTTFLGNGVVSLTGGSVTFEPGGRMHFPLTQGLRFQGGAVAGNGAIYIESTGIWTGGILAEDAVLQVQKNKDLTISGTGEKSIRRAHLVTLGTVHHTGDCTVDVREGSSVEVPGTYLFEGDGGLTGGGDLYVGGYLRKSGGTRTSVVEPVLNNLGEVEVASGSLVFVSQPAQVVEGALTGGTWIVGDRCALELGKSPIGTNAATVTLTGECDFPQIDTMTTNSGTFRLLARRGFKAVEAFTNSGTLELAGGAFMSGKNLNTGLWSGWGVVDGGFTNRGTLQPIAYQEGLRVTSGFSQNSAGILDVTISGRNAGQFSKLRVDGSASLNGVLKISFGAHFIPLRGDAFEILTCKSRTGTFASVQGYDLGNGLYANVVYTPTSAVVLIGDYLPAATQIASVAAARRQEPGAWLSLPGIVSAVFSDCFFVQDANRTAGLRVVGVQTPPTVGRKVQVVGRMTPFAPCVTLEAAQWITYADPAQPPRPLGVTNLTLGGADNGQQGGVWNAVGLNNVGLLVTVVGRARYKDATGFVYLDDGSGVLDGNTLGRYGAGVPGVRVILPPGAVLPDAKWIAVTGISYRLSILDRDQRAVIARSREDIRGYY